MEEIIKILDYEVNKKDFDEYIKFRIHADTYALGKGEVPSNSEYERSFRWKMCVKKVMELHHKICNDLHIEHIESLDDPFYKAFHRKVNFVIGDINLKNSK